MALKIAQLSYENEALEWDSSETVRPGMRASDYP